MSEQLIQFKIKMQNSNINTGRSKEPPRPTNKTVSQISTKKLNRSASQKKDQENTSRTYEEQLQGLQFKLIEKKQAIQRLKEELIQNNLLWQEEKRNILQERTTLERQITILKQKIDDERQCTLKAKVQLERLTEQFKENSKVKEHLHQNTQQFDKLQERISTELSEANKQVTALKYEIQHRDNKILSLEENITHLESKINKMKQKFDSQKQDLLERDMAEAKKRKLKQQELSETINKLQERQQQFSNEVKQLRAENKELKEEKEQIKEKLNEIQSQQPEVQHNNKMLKKERDEFENQINKLNQICKNQQTQLETNNEDILALSESLGRKNQTIQAIEEKYEDQYQKNKKLKQENCELLEELRNYKNLVEKIEHQNYKLTDTQTKNFDEMEQKLEKISREVGMQKQENDYLRKINAQLKDEVNDSVLQNDQYVEQIHRLKKQNATLEAQMRQLDDKLRDMVREKDLDVAQLKRNTASARPRSIQLMRKFKQALSDSEDSSLE